MSPIVRDEKFYALEEYKLASRHILMENKMYWERFKILFLVNSGLLTALGYLPNINPNVLPKLYLYWAPGISFTGFWTSFAWFFALRKLHANLTHFVQGTWGPGSTLGFKLFDRDRHKAFFGERRSASTWFLIVPFVWTIVWGIILCLELAPHLASFFHPPCKWV